MKIFNILLICLVVCSNSFAANDQDTFKAQFAGQQTIDGKNTMAVTFSSPLESRQNLDSYFSVFTKTDVAVEGAWVLSQDPQTVYFVNIEPDTKYTIKIHKGLKAKAGETLTTAKEYRVKTRRVQPTINFDSNGFILASKLNQGLPVNTLNIDKADIDFFRVKPEFHDEFSRHFGRRNNLEYYQSKDLRRYADLVYSGRWDFEIQKNLRTPVNISITHIKELARSGIYFAVLRGAGHYNYSYSSTWFTISDLGLHIKTYQNLMQVHVQSLETAQPLKGVTIEGFDKKGRSSVSVVTGDSGVARITGKVEHLKYIVATSRDNITFVSMNMPAIDLSEFKMATEPFRPLDLFVYGPRDLYRPGERVVMDGLLRNQDGQMTAVLPIQASIIRPDGRMMYEFKFKGEQLNHYHYEYDLPQNAMTGKWRVKFKQSGSNFKEYTFIVAEFLPERMKLSLNNQPDHQSDVPVKSSQILKATEVPVIHLKGDFLYGAPASGSKANAAVHIKPARQLFKEKWPGFEFGDITDNQKQYYETKTIRLDENGKGQLKIENQWDDTRSPLWLTANVSLYDSGGRPVVRTQSWQVWPQQYLVGIRPLFEDDQVDGDGTAVFEIMVADNTGKRITADGLKAVVIREHREYYWEFRHGRWQWHFTSQSYPVDSFNVDISKNGTAKLNVPVKWGAYRLEITYPETGLVTSYRVWAGWHPDSISSNGGANRPDRVSLVLDKPAYASKDRAKVMVKAPNGGTGYLFVEADTNLLTIPITVPVEGKEIEFHIDPSWERHDLYVSALIVRNTDESPNVQLPKRSVGLIPLPLDRSRRKLRLQIDAPSKIEPNQTIDVLVGTKQFDLSHSKKAWVTLAAVDVGVLNLTGFKTPSPHDYFFQTRRYSAKIHDVYQRLIEANKGAWARQRFGGDAPSLSRGGDRPSTDVRIVAISKQAVQVDENGQAMFKLDIPDFNGAVRLMAIGHTASDFGSSQKEMTIAAPLVTQITMPRFLSMGDKANLIIDIHNMTLDHQVLDVTLETSGPVRLIGKTTKQVTLGNSKKTALVFPVFAQTKLGPSQIQLTVNGLMVQGVEKQVQRTWTLDTRPAYPAETQMFRTRLEPKETFDLGSSQMGKLLKETIDVQTMISTSPPINILDHVRQLNAYPYGCLEQTTSGIFPHVILSGADFNALGVLREQSKTTDQKIKTGIQRLMEKQKSSGGFGLWSANGPESYWLSCYVTDFLLDAKQAGYDVPATALSKALERLKTYIRRSASIHPESYYDQKEYRAAVRAYAGFVLARVQGISLGDARAVYRSIKDDLVGVLGFVHAGLALSLSGDMSLGEKALKTALGKTRDAQRYYGDYGSNLRDFAHAFYLLSTFYPTFNKASEFMFLLQDELDRRVYLSTQDRNALVLAGSISLKNRSQTWQAAVKTGQTTSAFQHAGLKQIISVDGESAAGFEIINTGQQDLYVAVTLAGYPAQQPDPVSNKVEIQRRYLTLDGTPLPQDDEQNFKSGDRMLVELSFSADQRMPNGLIVDLLPAGLELEDPHLSGSTVIDVIKVDKKTVEQWHQAYEIRHTEYRDDRFVAAIDIHAKEHFRIFYPVRVVSPGSFLVPPPLVEDMYKPHIRGIGKVNPLMSIEN